MIECGRIWIGWNGEKGVREGKKGVRERKKSEGSNGRRESGR